MAPEKEREQITKGIHDVISAIHNYAHCLQKFPRMKIVEEIHTQLASTVSDTIESLSQISNKLSPHILRNFGLKPALHNFIGKITDLNIIKIKLDFEPANRFNKDIETTIFGVTTHLQNNTIKHSRANILTLNILLNGCIDCPYINDAFGFDLENGLIKSKGMGLKNIITRVEPINGECKIISYEGDMERITIPLNYNLKQDIKINNNLLPMSNK